MGRFKKNYTELMNDITYLTYFNKYKQICMNLFQWDNLPEGIEEKHLEEFLFQWGVAIFFKDPNMSYMCLKADRGGQLNVYGEPLNWWATGFNYHKNYKADNCVIIDNNKLRLPTLNFINYYAMRIADIERTADVNVKANKTPYIITCDDKDVLTMKSIFNKIDGNVPAIFPDKGLNMKNIEVLKTGVPFLGADLQDYKHTLENELLTFLGINNSPVDKKERLITDEANSNNQLIGTFAQIQLSSRELACQQINEMYGLNVTVTRRDNISDYVDAEGDEEDDT